MFTSNNSKALLTVLFALAIVGCDSVTSSVANNQKTDAAPMQAAAQMADSPAVATVNGKPITQSLFTAYFNQRSQGKPMSGTPEEMDAVINELIDMELVYQDAQSKGIDRRPEVLAQLQLQQYGYVSRVSLQEFSASNTATEAEQLTFYEEQVKSQAKEEYKARHILLETEEQANEIIAKLDAGEDFVQLAKVHSTGPSGPKGGDLGWFSTNRMVAPFSEAVVEMEKGSYSKKPVKTQFGFHIILLEDVRTTQPPSFEDAKGQIQSVLRNQKLQAHIEGLRESAKIEMEDLPATEGQ